MKLSVKNVKIHDDMSEETMCYSATLYVDGVRAAGVSNRGQGGCNEYRWADGRCGFDVERHVATLSPSQLPANPEPWMADVYPLSQTVDSVVDDLVIAFDADGRSRALNKTHTLYRRRSEAYRYGEWHTVNAPYSEGVQAFLYKKYGDDLGDIFAVTTRDQAAT